MDYPDFPQYEEQMQDIYEDLQYDQANEAEVE